MIFREVVCETGGVNDHSPYTSAVSAGRPHEPGDPVNTAIELSTTYRASGDRRYARSGTPNWETFERVLGELEGGEAVAFSSGLAAMSAVLHLAPGGGTVAASDRLYVGTNQLLGDLEASSRLRVRRFSKPDDPVLAEADLVIVEDPTNPGLERIDVADVAAAAPGIVVADNTIATPFGSRPLLLGADVVVHSATKFIGGHSDLLMGVVVAADTDITNRIRTHRLLHGAVPGALEAFLATRGVRTLGVRMDRAVANARELATRLDGHPKVARAHWPGVGALVALQLNGDVVETDAFIDRLELWTHATSLGGVESTIERRWRWADEGPHVPVGLVRMSVGIEDVEDLWADLVDALG